MAWYEVVRFFEHTLSLIDLKLPDLRWNQKQCLLHVVFHMFCATP